MVILEPGPLHALDVVEELDRSIHHEDARRIDGIQNQGPFQCDGFERGKVRFDQKEPIGQRDHDMEGIPWPKIFDQKVAQFVKFTGPERRDFKRRVRCPVTAFVAGAVFQVVHSISPQAQ